MNCEKVVNMCTDAANENTQNQRTEISRVLMEEGAQIVKVLAEMVPKPKYVPIFLGLAQRLV